MIEPCKHGHIDGALHVPCYQCKSEYFEEKVKQLERQIESLHISLTRKELENHRLQDAIERHELF